MLAKVKKDNKSLALLAGISFGGMLGSTVSGTALSQLNNLATILPSNNIQHQITANADTTNTWNYPFDNFKNNYITSKFGMRWLGKKHQFHDGVDIANNALNGKSIKCIHGGKVVKIGHQGYTQMDMGYYVVVVSPDGYTTVYQEYSFYKDQRKFTTVKVGQEVKTGDQIGVQHYGHGITHIHIGVTAKGVSFSSAMKHWSDAKNGTKYWSNPMQLINNGIKAQQAATNKPKPQPKPSSPTKPVTPPKPQSSSSAKPVTPPKQQSSSAQPQPKPAQDQTIYANKVLPNQDLGTLQDVAQYKEHKGQSQYKVGNVYYHVFNNGAYILGSTDPNDPLFTNDMANSSYNDTNHPSLYVHLPNQTVNITWTPVHSPVDGSVTYRQNAYWYNTNINNSSQNSSSAVTPSTSNTPTTSSSSSPQPTTPVTSDSTTPNVPSNNSQSISTRPTNPASSSAINNSGSAIMPSNSQTTSFNTQDNTNIPISSNNSQSNTSSNDNNYITKNITYTIQVIGTRYNPLNKKAQMYYQPLQTIKKTISIPVPANTNNTELLAKVPSVDEVLKNDLQQIYSKYHVDGTLGKAHSPYDSADERINNLKRVYIDLTKPYQLLIQSLDGATITNNNASTQNNHSLSTASNNKNKGATNMFPNPNRPSINNNQKNNQQQKTINKNNQQKSLTTNNQTTNNSSNIGSKNTSPNIAPSTITGNNLVQTNTSNDKHNNGAILGLFGTTLLITSDMLKRRKKN